nr:MAG TPA: hypothetical protein [Caudoviricetes sp.]
MPAAPPAFPACTIFIHRRESAPTQSLIRACHILWRGMAIHLMYHAYKEFSEPCIAALVAQAASARLHRPVPAPAGFFNRHYILSSEIDICKTIFFIFAREGRSQWRARHK